MPWTAQHLGGCHSFTPSVFLGTHTMLGVGDIDMSKTERSPLSQNYGRRDNKACNYKILKSGFIGKAQDAVKACYRLMLVQGSGKPSQWK